MSHVTYDKLWRTAQDLLASTIQSEPTQVDRREQRKLLATLYVRYILIANTLSECVDQMVQPQKRALIRKLLEATLGRILELKSDLVEADLCEFSHCGDILGVLNVTPQHTELKIPLCFRNEVKQELEYRKRIIDSVLGKLGFLEKVHIKIPLTEQQAIMIIQVHERARQGRLRAQFMREIRNLKDKGKPTTLAANEADKEQNEGAISLPAALRIQKVWRGYAARRQTKRSKLEEMLLIGMIPPPKNDSEDKVIALKIVETRRKMQIQRQKEYEDCIKSCKDNLEKYQRATILEQLSDQVRTWLFEYREQTGKIPDYTGSERSASRMITSRQGTGTESELSKSTQVSSKESKKGKTAKQKETREEEDEAVSKTLVSAFLPEMTLRREEYDEVWKNKDETENPKQLHYVDIIETEQMTIMEDELRKIVDEMMRAELQILQEAMDRDKGHKGKKVKKASKKARRGGKKSKKKKEKDLTPDRTTESLLEELVANGIIKKCPEIYLKEFIGDKSSHNPIPYNKGKREPRIAIGDIRQILTEYCVTPLLSQQLHETTPHIKSVLIAGPTGSGKDMLVQAICTETGATLFDLTPANIVGKYPGKSGFTMLIHLVTKVARLLPPAIIYMDNAERPFVKKIPKTDKTDPKRLKKDLPKIIKNFASEDRIILIGVTACPWESDQKLLQQVYQKYLVIPRPDYSSRYSIWSHLLGQFSAINWQFDMSGISKISDGYTAGSIVSTVTEIMTIKRKLQLRVKPLSPLELVNALAKRIPVYKEEEEAMNLWWSKTPTFKRRLKAVESLLELEAEIQAKQANAKRK